MIISWLNVIHPESHTCLTLLGNFCIEVNVLICQIPLLLSIGEEDSALVKATESGDTDLVYLVLFHIWNKV